MRTIRLYKITTTYADPYARDYWSTCPASNEVHPATGLPYDTWTDAEDAEFVLPDGIDVDSDESGMLYDTRSGMLLEIKMDRSGEPRIWVGDVQRTLKRAR